MSFARSNHTACCNLQLENHVEKSRMRSVGRLVVFGVARKRHPFTRKYGRTDSKKVMLG